MTPSDRTTARRLASESLARGDATGWFEALYDQAQGDAAQIPWADLRVNSNLSAWLAGREARPRGKQALVIGCGLGDDAESLAGLGYRVTAFDVSSTAIEWCRRRFPASGVDYREADLLRLPDAWRAGFDFVLEVYTLQVLPPELRITAMAQMAGCVAPDGTLLVIARGRRAGDDRGTMPWPLTEEELAHFTVYGLEPIKFEKYIDGEDPPVRRFRAEYHRPAVA